jgi:hypothetical protein
MEHMELSPSTPLVYFHGAKIAGTMCESYSAFPCAAVTNDSGTLFNVRVEDGKLFYENKWFHKGQLVFVESKEHGQER